MSNVITFPSPAARALRAIDEAAARFDTEAMIALALAAEASEARERARRWLAEVLNVKVS